MMTNPHSHPSRLAAPLLAFATLLAGCAQLGGTHARTDPTNPLSPTLAAHGGLDRWREFRSMTYRMVGFPLTEQVATPSVSRVDLVTRRNRIDAEGYQVGFDGTDAWATPAEDAVGLPPRFYALGSFYFVGMPFVFADAGANVCEDGTATVNGRVFRQLRVSYLDGTGHSDADHYTLLVDPTTERLAWIHHTVTEANGEQSDTRVAWRFDEWQATEGLSLPAKMTFFQWAEDGPATDDGASFSIDRMALAKEPFPNAIYESGSVDAFAAPRR